ncbi:hypothetical protein [Bacillus ndiopicus]|uniref:hypothetical protein n=1 Tax=Bacillus ndiopicus TaxID=1347368 RepID=UPI0005A7CE4B|nr:hypothetical protein [Bacillus ndiopicus]
MQSFLFLLFALAPLITNNSTISATLSDSPQPYEEILSEIGYKTVIEASQDFEQHFKQKLQLPLLVPPISFTHQVGRLNNLDGETNDYFEVKFINNLSPKNHFKIEVRPIEHKIEFNNDKYTANIFKLNNGIEAKYLEKLPQIGFNLFVFERDNWQYIFGIDKRVSNKLTPEILVQLANSIGN